MLGTAATSPRKLSSRSTQWERIETGAEISGTAMVKGLAAIKAALEAEGIEFMDDAGVPGVRLHPKKRKGNVYRP